MPSQTDNHRPLIVVLTLDKANFYNDMYADFNTLLKRHADVEQATTPSEARAFFNRDPKPAAILAADESLTASTRATLLHEAASYVRSGGTIIFMGLFSSFSRPNALQTVFSTFDLPWRSGSYHRTTFALNPAMALLSTDGLAAEYSQKALHVADVPQSNAVYLPSDEARTQSAVFGPRPIEDRTEAPVAFAGVGEGKVGYVGDVNNEDETMTVVLRMCGLGP